MGFIRDVWARWRRGVNPPVRLILLLCGIAVIVGTGAGIADVVKHGRRTIGTGAMYGRFVDTQCSYATRTGGCRSYDSVHVQIDRADTVITVASDDLYRLVGPSSRQLPVTLEEDTFSHKISRVRYAGRWYDVDNPRYGLLFLLVPGAVLGLLLMVLNARPLVGVLGRVLTGRRALWRWLALAAGAAIAIFFVAVGIVGLTGDRYDAGSGELYGRYAAFTDSYGYAEGAHVHVDGDGTETTVTSSVLYDLLGGSGRRLSVDVSEKQNGDIAGVTYQGRYYDLTGGYTAATVTVVFALAALGLWIAGLNGRALMLARRTRAPAPAGLGG